MSSALKALSIGSQQPPLAKGVLRIYGMRFCPYVHRVRLVLAAKNISHEIVNIHLKKKPEWFLEKSPEGKVPLLEQDSKLLWESLVISDYLDEAYPGQKLWSEDPYIKGRQKIALEVASKISNHVVSIYKERSNESFENLIKDLSVYEKHFGETKKPYFSGDKCGMVDLMLWPHMEVFMAIWHTGMYNGKSFLSASERPLFTKWVERMQNEPVVKKCSPGKEHLATFFKTFLDGEIPDYDLGL